VPGAKTDEQEGAEAELDEGQRTLYRSVVARANFLAQDQPDIRFAVKELCRKMATPTKAGWEKLKKLCRYIRVRPRVVQKIRFSNVDPKILDIYVDSDWGGCRETRKSTSGGCVMWNGACLKQWSTTQNSVAMSSGEAEYYAAVKGAAEGLAIQAMCRDLGIELKITLYTDSSACKGICNRRGLGKIKHVDVQMLWLQSMVYRGTIRMRKVLGTENPADLNAKYLNSHEIGKCVSKMSMVWEPGRRKKLDEIDFVYEEL
jgi:hypothetical protein